MLLNNKVDISKVRPLKENTLNPSPSMFNHNHNNNSQHMSNHSQNMLQSQPILNHNQNMLSHNNNNNNHRMSNLSKQPMFSLNQPILNLNRSQNMLSHSHNFNQHHMEQQLRAKKIKNPSRPSSFRANKLNSN
jgi:hypothetical protein